MPPDSDTIDVHPLGGRQETPGPDTQIQNEMEIEIPQPATPTNIPITPSVFEIPILEVPDGPTPRTGQRRIFPQQYYHKLEAIELYIKAIITRCSSVVIA